MPEPAPFTIEPAGPGDAPEILALIRELAGYERMADRVVATVDGIRDSIFGPDPSAEVLLARVSGRPVGFALWFHNYSTFLGRRGLYLEDLFVRPEARGRGIGRALLGRLAHIAIERDCGRLEWAVLDWNAPAIRFYRALGAAPLDDWTLFRLDGAALERLAATPPGPREA